MSDWEKVTKSGNDGWEKVPKAGEDGWEKMDKKKGASKKAPKSTNLWEDFKIGSAGVVNTFDRALTGINLGLQHLHAGPNEAGDRIYRDLQDRIESRNEWANPDKAEQGLTGKLAGAALTLPGQIAAFPFSPFTTGQEMLESGEDLSTALKGTAIDTAGNSLGAALGPVGKGVNRVITGAAAGAGQEYLTRKGIQSVAEREETKKKFEPTGEDLAVSGIIGGAMAKATRNDLKSGRLNKPKNKAQASLDKLREIKKAETPAPQETPSVDPGARVFENIMESQLTGWQEPVRNNGTGNGIDTVLQQLEQKRLEDAQKAYEQKTLGADQGPEGIRQNVPANDLEREVARQGLLDRNAAERKRQEQAPTGYPEWTVDQAAREAQDTFNFVKDLKQDTIVEDFGNNDPMSRMPNMRIDENGMPIRADLSMEAQNLQNPLQRNLWGDELGPALDQTRSLTEAMDATPPGPQRDAQVSSLGGVPRGQRGAIDVKTIAEALGRPQDLWKAFRGAFTDTEMDNAEKALNNPGSRDTIVFLSPKEFHQLAQKRPSMWDLGIKGYNEAQSYGDLKRELIRDGLKSKDGLTDIPYLRGVVKDGKMVINQSTGGSHNGRHRMDIFKELGVEKVPVRLHITQAEGFPGWGSDNIPKSILGENGIELPMPENLTRKGNATPEKLPELSLVPKSQRGAVDRTLLNDMVKLLFHGGRKFSEWNPATVGTGEGMGVLGPGLYASDQANTAELYKKYGGKNGIVSELAVDLSNVIDTRKELTPRQEEIYLAATKALDDLGLRASTNGLKMALRLARGDVREKARQAVVKAGLDGIYEHLNDDFGNEYAIFNPEAIKQVSPKDTPQEKFVPRSQRGALDFGSIPDNPDPKQVVKEALTEGKDGSKLMKNFESGSTLAAMRRGSAAVRGGGLILQNADKRSDLNIRRHVFPTEQALRKFSDEDFELVWGALKEEMLQRSRFTGEQLEQAGFTETQLVAYQRLREMQENALDATNDARLSQGQDPITPQEFYVSSRWSGDFRRPVYDAEGKLVWYLAAQTKAGLNKQTKALLAEHPDLKVDPSKDHHVRSPGVNEMKLDYSTMLDIVGRDSEAGEKIQRWFEEQEVELGKQAFAQEKHFEKKGNVRGFVGDRPGTNPVKEAKAGFAQQIQYAKNAFKWAEIQKAAEDLKQITNDPDLVKAQPNNVAYLKDLFKNYAGLNEARFVRNLEDGLRDSLGVSPRLLSDAVGGVKSFFILQKLAASAGYTLANMIQYGSVLPHMVMMQSQGFKGNPLVASVLGITTGLATAVGHYANKAGADFTSVLKQMPDGEFLTKAYQYAEDNGITARSIYDESPIQNHGSLLAQAGELAGKTMTIPETGLRASAFMSYVYMLRQSGQFDDNLPMLFQKAEEYTNASMVDYRAGERPLIFSKLGATGNLMNTLQTFPMNFYNQWAMFAKEASKGNVAPLMAAFALQYGVAGAMGIPGFQDLDSLWNMIKPMLSDKMFAKVKDFDPKLFVLEHLGDAGLYGKFAEHFDLGITSRVAAPAIHEMPVSPFGMIGDLAEQATNVGKVAMDPSNKTKQAQALMSVAPVGLQGYLETGPLRDQTSVERGDGSRMYYKSNDLADRSAGYVRSPEQEQLRKTLGLKTLQETKAREVDYRTKKIERDIQDRSRSLTEKYYDAVRNGDEARAQDLYTLYAQLNSGKTIDKEQIKRQINEEFLTELERTANKGRNASTREWIKYRRALDLLEK